MAATLIPVLAKLAIPMGIGLLFFAARGKKAPREGVALAKEAVKGMQLASGTVLQGAINGFQSAGDPTTAGGLQFQHGRLVSRGSPGFTSTPTYDKDVVLQVNNREFATRLIQLEGRALALRAWSEAYQSIGATNLARDLLEKANALDEATKPDAGGDSGGGGSAPFIPEPLPPLPPLPPGPFIPPPGPIVPPTPGPFIPPDVLPPLPPLPPSPSPSPVVPPPTPAKVRRVVIVKDGDGEFRITERLLGKGQGGRFKELVSENIPTDADGRNRRKYSGKDANRKGGLEPGLHPGQKLFIPNSWVLIGETSPIVPPSPAPSPILPPVSDGERMTRALILMVTGKNPGQEDSLQVKNWQAFHKRTADGKYGPGDAVFIADTYGLVPPTPLYWPKNNTAKALAAWKQEMARLALMHPDKKSGFDFAGEAGKQPGFNAPSTSKVRSRLLGDGLGMP